MTLIGTEMGQLRAERAAPQDSMTAISGMPEVECAPHFGDVATNQIGIASKTAAGEDQRIAPDPLVRAVRTGDLDSENAVIRTDDQQFCRAVRKNDDVVLFGRIAQAIDQFAASTGWQAMHAQGGMCRIVGVVDHLKGKDMTLRKPIELRHW